MDSDGWDESAGVYAEVTRAISYYRDTADAIVARGLELAPLGVLELGCGSNGLVLGPMLRTPLQRYVSTDRSQSMVDVLARSVSDPRAEFVACDAAEIREHVQGAFDLIVANNAIWMFNLGDTITGLRDLSRVGSTMLFTIAEWDLAGSYETLPTRYEHLNRALREMGLPAKEHAGSMRKLSSPDIESALSGAGWTLSHVQGNYSRMGEHDWANFYAIPAILGKSIPAAKDRSDELISRAFENGEHWADDLAWSLFEAERKG